MEQHAQAVKQTGDWLAGGITFATVMGWMPSIAALVTAIYTAVRIWETATVRRLLKAICARCAAWWEQ